VHNAHRFEMRGDSIRKNRGKPSGSERLEKLGQTPGREITPTTHAAIIAIDILLKADARMLQHAEANNERWLKAFPKGFGLDAAHRPHITMEQRFVRAEDLDKAYAAIGNVLEAPQYAPAGVRAIRVFAVEGVLDRPVAQHRGQVRQGWGWEWEGPAVPDRDHWGVA